MLPTTCTPFFKAHLFQPTNANIVTAKFQVDWDAARDYRMAYRVSP